MLGKLFKHELQATARSFVPSYIFMIVLMLLFSLLMRITSQANETLSMLVTPISMSGFIVLMVAIFIASYVFVILRFYRTTSTSEAYLTFTLPVSTHQIIFSKWIVAGIWQLVTAVLSISSIIGMMIISGNWVVPKDTNIIQTILEKLGMIGVSNMDLVILLLTLVVGTFASILQFYLSIALGQLVREHRVIASIGFYLAIYMILQFVSLIFLLPVAITANMNNAGMSSTVFLITIAENILLSVACYFVTAFVMKKHLNIVS